MRLLLNFPHRNIETLARLIHKNDVFRTFFVYQTPHNLSGDETETKKNKKQRIVQNDFFIVSKKKKGKNTK